MQIKYQRKKMNNLIYYQDLNKQRFLFIYVENSLREAKLVFHCGTFRCVMLRYFILKAVEPQVYSPICLLITLSKMIANPRRIVSH